MKEQRRTNGAFRTVATFGLGAAVGSIVALLYAPASGKVTRKRLAMRARNLQRAAIRRLGETRRVIVNKAEGVREAATEWISDHVPHGNGRHTTRRRTLRHASAN